MLPPDAVFRPDDGETPPSPPVPPPAAKPAPKPKRTRSGRFAALNAFVDFGISAARLTPAEALVWLILFRDTQGDGTARTAQSYVASRTGLNVRTVRRAVAALTAKGMLTVVRRGRLGGGPSRYRVHPAARA
jgi:hypothetical protein